MKMCKAILYRAIEVNVFIIIMCLWTWSKTDRGFFISHILWQSTSYRYMYIKLVQYCMESPISKFLSEF